MAHCSPPDAPMYFWELPSLVGHIDKWGPSAPSSVATYYSSVEETHIYFSIFFLWLITGSVCPLLFSHSPFTRLCSMWIRRKAWLWWRCGRGLLQTISRHARAQTSRYVAARPPQMCFNLTSSVTAERCLSGVFQVSPNLKPMLQI